MAHYVRDWAPRAGVLPINPTLAVGSRGMRELEEIHAYRYTDNILTVLEILCLATTVILAISTNFYDPISHQSQLISSSVES